MVNSPGSRISGAAALKKRKKRKPYFAIRGINIESIGELYHIAIYFLNEKKKKRLEP